MSLTSMRISAIPKVANFPVVEDAASDVVLKLGYLNLKKQREVYNLEVNDMFMSLPTGSVRSVCFAVHRT